MRSICPAILCMEIHQSAWLKCSIQYAIYATGILSADYFEKYLQQGDAVILQQCQIKDIHNIMWYMARSKQYIGQ
jgi:hypothetical protein